MKDDPGKSGVLLSYSTQRVAPFDNVPITSSLTEKVLEKTSDSELKLEKHINKICNMVKNNLMLFRGLPIT